MSEICYFKWSFVVGNVLPGRFNIHLCHMGERQYLLTKVENMLQLQDKTNSILPVLTTASWITPPQESKHRHQPAPVRGFAPSLQSRENRHV